MPVVSQSITNPDSAGGCDHARLRVAEAVFASPSSNASVPGRYGRMSRQAVCRGSCGMVEWHGQHLVESFS